MVTIELTSGIFEGSPKKLQDIIKRSYIRGIITGVNKATKEYIPTVAYDTGQLRAGFETTIKSQVTNIRGKDEIVINFKNIRSPKYAKYHIRGSNLNPNFKGGYKKPTTSGTKPIDPEALLGIIKIQICRAVGYELRQVEGLDLTNAGHNIT